MPLHNRLKCIPGLLLIVSIPLEADDRQQDDRVYLQIAHTLISEFPHADPLALEHARQLVDGVPIKRWKNCWMKNTLQQEQDRAQSFAVVPE
ncbi:MAG: hypothetical protein H8E21_10210 [Gammaproteobacteria bacterium]|nr:hypothetical protein [Gammaproteobacteria bacterium]